MMWSSNRFICLFALFDYCVLYCLDAVALVPLNCSLFLSVDHFLICICFSSSVPSFIYYRLLFSLFFLSLFRSLSVYLSICISHSFPTKFISLDIIHNIFFSFLIGEEHVFFRRVFCLWFSRWVRTHVFHVAWTNLVFSYARWITKKKNIKLENNHTICRYILWN